MHQLINNPQYRLKAFFLGVFLFLINHVVFGQQNDKKRDSTSTSFSFQNLSLPDPESIESKYEYDPQIHQYKYSKSLGEYSIQYPLYLTPRQFQALIQKEQMRNYFKEKNSALNGKTPEDIEKRKGLLPIFYVNSGFFETVFGSNEIEIIPQGSVEIDLGLLFNKQDNPSFSPQNQRNFTFDFDQRISLSLQGNIGTRLSVQANYDTESTFDFQNQLKLAYEPTEDAIIRAIEVGNVSLPLNTSLIQGAQSLFGVKAQFQFGKTTITGVFSEQRSESRTVSIEGGGTVEDFELFAADYDENRHFFLSHYFRDTYDNSLKNYPFIDSNVQVTRIQVWVTNRANNNQGLTNTRNLVALQDLGESDPSNIGFLLRNPSVSNGLILSGNSSPNTLPDNSNNQFNPEGLSSGSNASTLLENSIRDIAFVQNGFKAPVNNPQEGLDYSVLENARLLSENQYTLNPQLGYISLSQRLNNDEILAVAFQYTKGGQVFQVGEFANGGVSNTQTSGSTVTNNAGVDEELSSTQNLIVKTLKSSVTSVNEPIWDLMMKNIYSLGAFRLEQDDFRLNLVYTDPSPQNFITSVSGNPLPEGVENTTLLQVFNLDKLNTNNDPVNGGDGFFDFFPGITVDTENGRIIFTTVEPFGEHLFNNLLENPGPTYNNPASYNDNQKQYVFNQLYSTTKIEAEQQQAEKNKFQLKGRYKNSGQNGISIGAFNVPRGSVRVTAGGRVLQEGIDYTVNYQLGRVEILDPALLASNTPIDISTENNAVFGQQTKRFSGINVEHKFSENFIVGGTLLNLRERPLTQKSNLNFEPINNTIAGLNGTYSTEVPFLTRLVNKLPNVDTEAPSNFSFRGEFAYLFANAPKAADFNGEVTSYIDDFEGAQTRIDISSPLAWELSSVPNGFEGLSTGANDLISIGQRRAGLSWYSIDPIFYSTQRPSGVSDFDISRQQTRRIFIQEIFPNTQIAQNQTRALPTLDLHYRPQERGPYNYNTNVGANPEQNFGGITRALNTTNFEQSNIEFIEFWVLNPYPNSHDLTGYINETNRGQIKFNIGNISEDVLKDGRKQFENGLPEIAGSTENTRETPLGRVPNNQSLVYAFDTNGGARIQQDAGFDGLKNVDEAIKFPGFGADPSNDDYEYFLQAGGTIEERYLRYNGTDGDSPDEVSSENRGRTTLPTVEDVNRDNTMNTIEQYFEYTIDFDSNNLTPGTNPLVNDVQNFTGTAADGSEIRAQWVQFKIPLSESTIRTPVNGATDLRSARFMRMLLTGFTEETLLRFGTLDLVRGNYRSYTQIPSPTLITEGINENVIGNNLRLTVSSVSLEENPDYVIPPGVQREQLNNNNTIISQDERSLDLKVEDLGPQDARVVYNNFNVDMRQYKNLELFMHAERSPKEAVEDGELVAIVRLGNDFTDNFYQIELPLRPTATTTNIGEVVFATRNPDEVWPIENRLKLPLDLLQKVKANITAQARQNPNFNPRQLLFFDENGNPSAAATTELGKLRVGIKGNPSFGNVRVLMLGIKNGKTSGNVSGTVWFNELRLSGLKNQGGWAATASVDTNLADFANITASGRRSTIGFGGIEQGPNERSQEDVMQYDVTTSVNLGQLLPKKWGIKIPASYSRGEELITPQYDPLNEDLLLKNVLDATTDDQTKNDIEKQSTDYTKRQSISLIGLRKERTSEKKPMPYDVENLSFSSTYNQTDHRDFEIEKSIDQSFNLSGTYNYAFTPWEITPLKTTKILQKGKYFQFLRDLNFNPLPTNISVTSGLNRTFNEQTFRDLTLSNNDIKVLPLQQRNFLFDWQYNLGFNLTKSLNLTFNSTNNRIVRNYLNEDNEIDRSISIWDGLSDIGDPNTLNQSLQANYELPFSKFPILSFIKSSYSYTGNFQWQKGSDVFRNIVDSDSQEPFDLGNTIQNSGVHRINNTFNLSKFYKEIGFVKRTSNKKKIKKKKSKDSLKVATIAKIAPRTVNGRNKISKSKKLKPSIKAYNTLVGIVSGVKRLSINYQNDSGTILPGYVNDVGFLGSIDPSLGFAFGGQSDVRQEAASKGYLTAFDEFNGQYQSRKSEQLDATATIDLIDGLKIDITANRTQAETYTENFQIDNDLQYQSLTPNSYGNFNISTILIKTAFQKSDESTSKAFDEFKKNRLIIANRLAGTRGVNGAFPDGYGPNSQAVLLPAFLAAYSGQNAEDVSLGAFRNIPLPNWNLRYTGLTKKKWFKKRFNRFSVSHSYRSSYTINQFQSNLEFNPQNPEAKDAGGNFINETIYGNISLTEQFSPLIKIDLETKGSLKVSTEIRKDRALSFSFDNSLLTEIQGSEFIIGLGYRIKDLTFATRLGDGKRRVIKSDLNLKADLSLRKNETVIRNLDVDNSQVTSGQDIYSLRFTTDYALSKNLTALFFYDHSFSEFSVSTAFPQTTIRSGFTLRYNFGN